MTDLNPFRIEISPRGYEELFNQMVASVPLGNFYEHTRPLVMWSSQPNRFLLKTDIVDVPIKITVERVGDYHQNTNLGNLVKDVTVVPSYEITTFSISLGRGKNRITAKEQVEGGRTAILEVVASTNTLFFESLSREIFKSYDKYKEQYNALYSKYSTRMLDQVVSFSDLLPTIQSIKTLAAKLLVRASVHFPAKEIGIRNLIEAFSLNTPVLISQRKPKSHQIERDKLKRASQNLSGQEAHVWFPNLSVTRWSAFSKMADSIKSNFKIVSLSDTEVKVFYKDDLQSHTFDFDSGTNFLTNLSVSNCFNGIDASASFSIKSSYNICAWTYPFDLIVTYQYPIGDARIGFDSSIPLDSGINFDADPVDPWIDGWVGWSLTGRFDSLNKLDSEISPALGYAGSKCVYTEGPYTQLFNSSRSDIDIEYEVEINNSSTEIKDYISGSVSKISLDFPYSGIGSGDLVAGESYPVVLKYSDSNNMSCLSAFGTVQIQEEDGVLSSESIVDGYIVTSITPTKSGPAQTWSLTDGTYSGISQPKKVLPGEFASFRISSIGPQQVGVPFSVTIQATDQYDNDVTDLNGNTKVNVFSKGGFNPSSIQPYWFNLVNGQATVELTMTYPGTGFLRFVLNPIYPPTPTVTTDSTTFTVI